MALIIVICFILAGANFTNSCSQEKRPKLYLKGEVYGTHQGITLLQYGGSFEILCTGPADEMVLGSSNVTGLEIFKTDKVNETTIKYILGKLQKQLLTLTCFVEDDFGPCSSALLVLVDDQPNVANFNCVSKNLDFLNCTWTSTNYVATFTLFVLYKETPTKLCTTDKTQMYCTWTNYDTPLYSKHEKKFHFTMTTCSGLRTCKRTSYEIDHLSIVKLNPPTNLIVLKRTSHSVALKWEIPYRQYTALDGVDHRVEYWYTGIHPREVNTSSVVHKFTRYQFEMHLPCADTFYEIKISIKPKQAANEEFWSDFASISIITEEDEIDAVKNVMCEKQRVAITPNIMVYELKKFKMKIKEEQSLVKRSISKLKAKAAQKNKY